MKAANISHINGMHAKRNTGASFSVIKNNPLENRAFTIEEIKKWLCLQNSLGDARYYLEAEYIIEANKNSSY